VPSGETRQLRLSGAKLPDLPAAQEFRWIENGAEKSVEVSLLMAEGRLQFWSKGQMWAEAPIETYDMTEVLVGGESFVFRSYHKGTSVLLVPKGL
jgi:hypothetical protein